MYLGIDLGTSNSAVAGYEKGKLRLFKSAEGADVLPSAIMVDRRGNMLVGKRAYDQAAYAPDMRIPTDCGQDSDASRTAFR